MATVIDTLITELVFKGDSKGLSKFESGLNRISGKMRDVGRLSVKLGAAVTVTGVAMLKGFASAETALLKIATQTGKPLAEIKKQYGDLIGGLTELTGENYAEIAGGVQKAISSGFEGQQAIELVTLAAKAKASGIFGDVGEAVSGATTLMQTLGITASEAMNTIAAAGQRGEGNVEDYANALKGLSANAGQFGISGSEISATLAQIAQKAESVSIAKTQIEAFMTSLIKPTTEGEKALLKFSEGTEYAGLTFGNLRDIVEDEGLSKAISILKKVVGDDVGDIGEIFGRKEAITFFANVDTDAVIEIEKGILDGGNAIQKAMDDANTTVGRQAKRIWQSLQRVSDSIGAELVPAFNAVRNIILDFVAWFKGLGDTSRKVVAGVLSFGPALIGVGVAMQALSFALSPIVKLMRLFSYWTTISKVANLAWTKSMLVGGKVASGMRIKLGLLWAQQKLQAFWTGIVTSAQWLWNAAMMANPVGLIIAGIIGAITAIGLLVKNWDSVVAWFGGLVETLIGYLPDFIKNMLGIESDYEADNNARPKNKGRSANRKSEEVITPVPDLIKNIVSINSETETEPKARLQNRGRSAGNIPGVTMPLATAPPASAGTVNNAQSNLSNNSTVTVKEININAPGADAKEIGQNVRKELRDQTNTVADSFDSVVLM